MAQTIKLKRSATPGAIPSLGSLELGEIAINTYDGKLYIKKDDGTSPDTIVEVSGAGGVAGGDFTFLDNEKAIFGAGSDLQIYHSGTHSFIEDKGTGNLYIDGSSSVVIRGETGNIISAIFNDEGSVVLKHNGDTKLTTTATGIDVTGTVTADGLTVSTATGSASPTATEATISSSTSASDWSTTSAWGVLGFYSADNSGGGAGNRAQISTNMEVATGAYSSLDFTLSNPSNAYAQDSWLKLQNSASSASRKVIVSADGGLTVDGTVAINSNSFVQTAATPSYNLIESDVTDENTQLIQASGTFRIRTVDDAGSSAVERMRIDHGTGDISFYDGAAAQGLFWDSSASALGIGTTTPGQKLEIKESSTGAGDAIIRLRGHGNDADNTPLGSLEWWNADSSGPQPGVVAAVEAQSANANGHMGKLLFKTHDGSGSEADPPTTRMTIDESGNVGIGTTSPSSELNLSSSANTVFRLDDTNGTSSFHHIETSGTNGQNLIISGDQGGTGGGALFFRVNGASEAMRIDSSGNVLVGKTSTGAATAGIELNGVNDILRIARDGGVLQELNRITSNGDIIEFRKDNSPVGSIGVDSGDNLYISASAANHAGIYFSDVGISAMQAGSLIDASVDLGTSSYRFKDLYLSGTATMDGLGIGTTSPNVPLEIHGADIATGATTTASSVLRLVRDVVDPTFVNRKDSAVDFMLSRQEAIANNFPYTRLDIRLSGITDSSEPTVDVMSLLHNGNVGIGTNEPQTLLDVEGAADTELLRVGISANENSALLISPFTASATNGLQTITSGSQFGTLIQGGLNGKLVLATRDNDGSDSIDFVSGGGDWTADNIYDTTIATFRADGSVGIGTNAPGAKLDLRGDMRLDGSAGTDRSIYFRNQGTIGGQVKSDKNLSLWAGSGGGTATQYLTIKEGGNVGIGTDSPSGDLQIGNFTGSRKLILSGANSSSDSSQIIFTDASGQPSPFYAGMGIRYNSDTNKLIIESHFDTGVSPNATTQPILTLDREDQSATFASDVIVSGDLFVTGTSTSVNVEDLNVEQGEITLNYGTGDTSAAANGAGIRIQDAVDASTDATILWNATNDNFEFSHGIDVTGSVTADGLTVDNSGTAISITNGDGLTQLGKFHGESTNGFVIEGKANNNLTLRTKANTAGEGIKFQDSAGDNMMFIDGTTGDISFYEDTGTNPKFFWDASAESLGIGNTNPSSHGAFRVTQTSADSGGGIAVETGTVSARLYVDGSGIRHLTAGTTDVINWDASGNVGIGTDSPPSTLTVLGPNDATGGITLTSTETDTSNKIGRIKNAHYTNAEEPFTFVQTRSEVSDSIINLGGSSGVENAATRIGFWTAADNTTLTGTEVMRVNSAQNVGIGETSTMVAGYKLQVRNDNNGESNPLLISNRDTSVSTTQNVTLNFGLSRDSGAFKPQAGRIRVGREGNTWDADDANVDSYMDFSVYQNNAVSTKLTIASDGNVGIGTASPSSTLDLTDGTDTAERAIRIQNDTVVLLTGVEGSAGNRFVGSAVGNAFFGTTSAHGLEFGTNNNVRMVIDSAGNATFSGGIVASGGISGLTLANGGISGTNYDISGVNQLTIADPGEGIVFSSGTSGDMSLAIVDDASDNILRYSGTNAVFDVQGDITASGTLTATSKSFDIEHPTKEGMRLRYGSLEGPENGVYVRGRVDGEQVIQLPDYWLGLVHEDTITVNLTSIGPGSVWVESIENNTITVGGSEKFFYHVFAERKDIEKLTVEYDV